MKLILGSIGRVPVRYELFDYLPIAEKLINLIQKSVDMASCNFTIDSRHSSDS